MHEGPELILSPEYIEDLEDLIDEAQTMYEAAVGGSYRLKAAAREAVNAEMQAAWAEHEKKMAAMDRKIDDADAEIKRLAIKRDVGNALAAWGVKTSYLRAAATLSNRTSTSRCMRTTTAKWRPRHLDPFGRAQSPRPRSAKGQPTRLCRAIRGKRCARRRAAM